jgi:hypothetical protein
MREMSSVVEGGSQAGQDLFAFRMCGRGGRYVDLGAGHYRDGSNTFQLERTLGWSGIAAEIDADLRFDWLVERPNTLMFDDALDMEVDDQIVAMAKQGPIDFLSLDLEPPMLTLQRLISLPLELVRFRVITCEHDLYRQPLSVKNAMRGILEGYGYIRVLEDQLMMATGESEGKKNATLVPVEDWWIDPQLVDLRFALDEARKIRYMNDRMHFEHAEEFNNREKES